jgi:5-methylcytosine-specific restriction protein A
MANKPLRPCNHAGCDALTREGYCDKHRPKPQRRESAEWHRLYSLRIWTEELRPTQLLREPWCRRCAQLGHRTKATVVDHVRPHRGNMAIFIDAANLQSLCKRCHDLKTLAERRQRQGQ